MLRGSKRRRTRSAAPPAVSNCPTASPRHRKLINLALFVALVAMVGAVVVVSQTPNDTPPISTRTSSDQYIPQPSQPTVTPADYAHVQIENDFAIEPESLDELLRLEPDEVAEVDIARMNLLVAEGLPGAEGLDVEHTLATLDDWARRVSIETQRHLYRVNDPRYAEHYNHSEAYFRAEMLLQVLQEDLGVTYDLTAVDNFSFADSRVAFLHGMIPQPGESPTDTAGGTCASMPVLYVAIGRRLGYPLNLVPTDGHLFVRWDGKDHPNPAWRERFNIEGAGEGFGSFDDDYYRSWPLELTERQVERNGYLVSMAPVQTFASFLAARGHCGYDHGQFTFAARQYENAYGYDPGRQANRAWFVQAASRTSYEPVISHLAQALDHHATFAGLTNPSRVGPWREEGDRQSRDILAELNDPVRVQQMNRRNAEAQQQFLPQQPVRPQSSPFEPHLPHQQPAYQHAPPHAGVLP